MVGHIMTQFYRFRSTKRLLDEDFQELEQQSIFFSSPEELNDPMEGFRDIVWNGDQIVWINLFKHFVHCLHWTYSLALVIGNQERLTGSNIPIGCQWSNPPTHKASKLFDTIWMRVRDECDLNELAGKIPQMEIAGGKHKVRSDELRFYLQLIHWRALRAVQEIYTENDLSPKQRLAPQLSSDTLLTRTGFFDLLPQIPEVNNISTPRLFSSIERLFSSMLLRHKHNSTDVGEQTGQFLLFDFPRAYVDQLSQLLWPEWYTACFTKNYHNSSMWANYGDGHRGVCLIFEAIEDEETTSLSLNQVTGWASNSPNDNREHWNFVPMRFHQVAYNAKPPEVDFFRSMGRPTTDALIKSWYTDQGGNFSECASQVVGPDQDVVTWQKSYWNAFMRDICIKTRDWEYEQEHRLILNGGLDQSLDKRRRTLTYDFGALKGIIFGMKTSDENKLKIMEIIRKKCKENNRSDFQIMQAYYSPQSGDIRGHEIPASLVIEGNQS